MQLLYTTDTTLTHTCDLVLGEFIAVLARANIVWFCISAPLIAQGCLLFTFINVCAEGGGEDEANTKQCLTMLD